MRQTKGRFVCLKMAVKKWDQICFQFFTWLSWSAASGIAVRKFLFVLKNIWPSPVCSPTTLNAVLSKTVNDSGWYLILQYWDLSIRVIRTSRMLSANVRLMSNISPVISPSRLPPFWILYCSAMSLIVWSSELIASTFSSCTCLLVFVNHILLIVKWKNKKLGESISGNLWICKYLIA